MVIEFVFLFTKLINVSGYSGEASLLSFRSLDLVYNDKPNYLVISYSRRFLSYLVDFLAEKVVSY